MRKRGALVARRTNRLWRRRTLHTNNAPPTSTNEFLKEPEWGVSELTKGKEQLGDTLQAADVRRIGQLSQLKISDQDIPDMLLNLNKILNFAKRVESGEPKDSLEQFTTLHAATHSTPLREDTPCDNMVTPDSTPSSTSNILSNATETHWGYFVVKQTTADNLEPSND